MDIKENQVYKFTWNNSGNKEIYTGTYLGNKRGFYLFKVNNQIIPVRKDYLVILKG